MGVIRMIWRSTGIGRTIDTIKNTLDEGSIVDGVKRTFNEDYREDNPITSRVYQSGLYNGKIEGYEEASDEYESKLLTQADDFLRQTQIFESERDAYEELLDKYEEEIDTLSNKLNKSEAENEYLQQLLLRDRKLRRMAR